MASICRVQARVAGTSGLPGLFTAYFSIAGGVATSAEAVDVAARVRAFFDAIKAYHATGVTIDVSGDVASYNDATGGITGITSNAPPAQVVATGTNELPSASMLGLRFSTALVINRRILRGRSFIGPLSTTTSTNAGLPTSAAATGLATAASANLASGATASKHVVWSRPKGTPPLGGASSQVLGYSADATKFWILRSRRD